jgi:hypothetical protein
MGRIAGHYRRRKGVYTLRIVVPVPLCHRVGKGEFLAATRASVRADAEPYSAIFGAHLSAVVTRSRL